MGQLSKFMMSHVASQKETTNVVRDKTYWAFLNLMVNPLDLNLGWITSTV